MPARFACYLVAGAVATAAFEADAEAEPPLLVEGQVALHYRRAPEAEAECPDEETLRERAADEFGFREPFAAGGAEAPARMRVEITRTAGDFLATVFSASAAGYSVFTERATSCDALVWRLGHLMGRSILRAPGPHAGKRVRLRYTPGPAECLSEVDFRRAVAGQGDGKDRFVADGNVAVSVTYEKLPSGGFRATIEHPGAKDGSEVQTHAHCETLGLKVAVVVYRFVPARGLPAPPPPAPPNVVEPEKPRPPAPPRVRPPLCTIFKDENCMNLSLTALAMGIMTVGYTPDVGGGFAVGGEINGEVMSFGFAVRGIFPSHMVARTVIDPTKSSYDVPFDLSQWSAQFVPCARWKILMGCAFGEIGALLSSEATGLYGALLVALGPRLGVDVPINERVSVFGFGEARFLPFPARFNWRSPPVDNPNGARANVKWEEPIVSAAFAAGIAVHFK